MLTDDDIIALRHRASSRRRDISKPWSDSLVFAREIEREVRARLGVPDGVESVADVIFLARVMQRNGSQSGALDAALRALDGHLATPPAGA